MKEVLFRAFSSPCFINRFTVEPLAQLWVDERQSHFEAGGRNWQTRISDALSEYISEHSHEKGCHC